MNSPAKYALIIVVLFFPVILSGQAQAPSLQLLIESAINKDYNLANQQLDIESSGIDAKKLKEVYLPRVSLTGQDGFLFSSFGIKSNEIKIPQLNLDIKQGNNTYTTTFNTVTAAVQANMLIYSGGQVNYLKKSLEEKIKAQTLLTEKDRQEIISQVTAAYDQLALLRQIRIVLDESEKRIAEYRRTADKAFDYGLITKYEHQKIEVAEAQLLSKTEEYEGSRELVLEQLYLLTNVVTPKLSLITDTLIPFNFVAFDTTIENRAELKSLDAQLAANQYKTQAENTWFIPQVQAGAEFGYFGLLSGHISSSGPVEPFGKKLSTGFPNLNVFPAFNIGIGFKWNLFNGMEGPHDVQKANIETEIIRNKKNEAREKLTLNLVNSHISYVTANTKINTAGRQKEISGNALNQATKEYKTGLITSSQLIDAENDFQNASLAYIQTVYNQRRAAVALLQASGNLTISYVQKK